MILIVAISDPCHYHLTLS